MRLNPTIRNASLILRAALTEPERGTQLAAKATIKMKRIGVAMAGLTFVLGTLLHSQSDSSRDRTGILVFQRIFSNSVPDGLYHVGGYVCTQGSERYGPDCVPEVVVPDYHDSATLKLEDGRVLRVTNTTLAGVASLEAMSQTKNMGTWSVTYRFTSTRENPLTHHIIQYVEVVFPMTISGKPHPVTKHISFDTSDPTLGAFTAAD
jgi:hypothetical protein